MGVIKSSATQSFHGKTDLARRSLIRGHCINISRRKWPFFTHPPCHAWSHFPRATHPHPSMTYLFFMIWVWVFLWTPQKRWFQILQQLFN